ncbi:hypothetical protein NDM229_008455 [Acinetobacter bereziniae]|nr:hypothetical protein NDM229_008455 [Acinetobacter bereziniae]
MENDLFYREDKIGFFIEIDKSKVKGNLYRMEVWIKGQNKTSFEAGFSKKVSLWSNFIHLICALILLNW